MLARQHAQGWVQRAGDRVSATFLCYCKSFRLILHEWGVIFHHGRRWWHRHQDGRRCIYGYSNMLAKTCTKIAFVFPPEVICRYDRRSKINPTHDTRGNMFRSTMELFNNTFVLSVYIYFRGIYTILPAPNGEGHVFRSVGVFVSLFATISAWVNSIECFMIGRTWQIEQSGTFQSHSGSPLGYINVFHIFFLGNSCLLPTLRQKHIEIDFH